MKRTRTWSMALAGAALVSVCAAGVVGADGKADPNRIVVDGSTTVGPIAKAFADAYKREHSTVNISVSESGSGNGVKSLINGTCQVADMSRFMKPEEFKAAVDKGLMPVAHVVAMDGIAVIVHPANPVKELTVEKVKDIYAGRISNWNQVGGPNQKIVKVSRDSSSGTYESFESLVMKSEKMAAEVEYVGSSGAIRAKVQSTMGAIGYVGLGFADRTVKALTINGIHPDRDTVASGRYPIARPLFMFTNGYPELGSHLHAFVTMHLSRQGQKIIESIGFVPVTNYPEESGKSAPDAK